MSKPLHHIIEAMFQQWFVNIGKRAGWMFLFCAMVLVASCDCQDLYTVDDVTAKVVCEVDWSAAKERPTGMTLMFYPVDGGAPYVTTTNSVDRAYVAIPAGVYNVFLFNQSVNEYNSVSFSGLDKWETIGISAADCRAPSWSALSGFSYSPTHVYVSVVRNFEFDGVKDAILRAAPQGIVYETVLKVQLKGAKYVRSVRGVLSGVAKTYYPTREMAGEATTRHALEKWTIVPEQPGDSVGYIVTSLTTLGVGGSLSLETTVAAELEFLLVDDKTTLSHNYNIAPSLIIAPTEMTISASVDETLPIPEVEDASTKNAGFDVSMNSWSAPHIIDLKF
ncbi:MAG: DUF5119 domain-containing protein [Bacteroidaceae bacterium]|nr:DUF5119 domain-containing protein [Bacteroidaceae bacterium]